MEKLFRYRRTDGSWGEWPLWMIKQAGIEYWLRNCPMLDQDAVDKKALYNLIHVGDNSPNGQR